MQIYYPSCNFRAIDRTADDRLREYASASGMEVAGCCQINDNKKTDHALYVCQACRETLEKQNKGTVSFWTVIAEDESFAYPDYSGLTVTIQDCWRDRNYPEIHKAVRILLQKMNINIVEMENCKENADFCGRLYCETTLYKEETEQFPAGTHPGKMGKELFAKLMEEQCTKYPEELVLCYCNSCYRGIALGGGKPVHLAQLLTGTYTITE